jgi:hypothetical protein
MASKARPVPALDSQEGLGTSEPAEA